MAAGVVRQRLTEMRILVIRLFVQRVPPVFKPLQLSILALEVATLPEGLDNRLIISK